MASKNLVGKKITILGGARSGVAVARMLKKIGADIFLSDLSSEEKMFESKHQLNESKIDFEFGKHSDRIYDASLFVISPGISETSLPIVEAKKRGIAIVSEIECASWFCNSPITAITGSAGKTTTTTLIGRMASDAKKKHFVAGNIGTPLSSFVLDASNETTAIVEISSFQLDFCFDFQPHVAIVTNITQNHMDRYENSMEKYSASKSKIFANQNENNFLIYNFDDPWTRKVVENRKNKSVQILPFSINKIDDDGASIKNEMITISLNGKTDEVIKISEMSLRGTHNIYNAMASTLASKINGISTASIRATLKNFKGVEHRQEFVAEIDGVNFINDSKATTVDSVKFAIEAVASPIILILGGHDKGNDYSQIENLVKEKVKMIIATGESCDKIEKYFSKIVPVEIIGTSNNAKPNIIDMQKVIELAKEKSNRGDSVLLSPACASFDWFNNYEERGNIFKELVLKLK